MSAPNPADNTRFCCPVSLCVMTDPITTPCGHTFDRSTIQTLFNAAQSNYSYSVFGGSAPVHCPTCRAVLPLATVHTHTDYTLKGIIEDAVAVFTGPPRSVPSSVTLTVQPSRGTAPVPSLTFTGNHIQVSVPPEAPTLRLNMIAVIDISGSMGGRATEAKPIAPGQKAEDSSLLSRTDLTAHSVRAIVNTLSPDDSLTVIGFDTAASIYLPPTVMTAQGRAAATAAVDQIKPRGGTSFWAGLKAALTTLETAFDPAANNVIIFQTDGESDPQSDPAMGVVGSLVNWKERHPDIKFTLHTIGYGYGDNLQSNLLREISDAGGGDFYYVPDGSILAQVCVHLFANLATATHTDISLRCDGRYIPVGFLQAGQTRDFIASGQTATLFQGRQEIATATTTEGRASMDAMAHGLFVDALRNGVLSGALALTPLLAALRALDQTPYVTALLTDLDDPGMYKGQIGKAFQAANYRKWGRHYLPAVFTGHRNQWPMNFKDESSRFYGSKVTKNAVASGVDIYESLPAIKASFSETQAYGLGGYAPAPRTIQATVNTGGGCFTGDTLVLTGAGYMHMDQIVVGALLADPYDTDKYNRVCCVVRYDVTTPQPITRLGKAGLTEFHPVLDKDEWVHPRSLVLPTMEDVSAVYNLILESGHKIVLCDSTYKRRVACTLAHDFEGPVISHSYFGKPVPGKPHILEDLRTAPNWATGYVICSNTQEERDDKDEIVRLICEFH
jgi:hypothetical protein